MWPSGNNEDKAHKLVAVAIDKDKGSQSALKWAVDNLLSKGQTVVLLHVKLRSSNSYTSPNLSSRPHMRDFGDESTTGSPDQQTRELFLPFRCFCTRKDIQCQDIVIEDTDIVRAIIQFVTESAIEVLVLGTASKGGFLRFKSKDIPGNVSKALPDFCTVYIISKGKISSSRSASRPAPSISKLKSQIFSHSSANRHEPPPSLLAAPEVPSTINLIPPHANPKGAPRKSFEASLNGMNNDANYMKSPFTHRKGPNGKSYGGDLSPPDTDISFVSSGRASIDRIFPAFGGDSFDMGTTPRLSNMSDFDNNSFESIQNGGRRSLDTVSTPPPSDLSFVSLESDRSSQASMEDVEAEMRRLKLELKQTMDMYSTACKEALSAKQKAQELQRWKLEEQQRLEEARLAEEAALAIAAKEKAKSKAAIEHAEAAQRLAEIEAEKRITAEMKALEESKEKDKVLSVLAQSDFRYRKYTIEEIESATNFFSQNLKIGEGGYGPVYKCSLDHTPVAVKVLRPDAAQGRSQFQREVEVLSCIRHPNMVLLLGACPEYGCLVYEYMSNGSLEDCLMRRVNKPPLSWQHRFRIAAEICTALLFLHQTKPEPLVHRDLKPANILLDRNYVSKISDVGLARLVPPSVADNVTQYRMTSTAGTFCYIDPEYQQTGMLGIKSDIYSVGIMFLQIVTAKPPMGIAHHVEKAIEKGNFEEMLDPAVSDWPVEETLKFARLSLQCAELRRKDRPDLGKVIMPELDRLRNLAEENMPQSMLYSPMGPSPNNSQGSFSQENVSYTTGQSGYVSSRSRSSTGGH